MDGYKPSPISACQNGQGVVASLPINNSPGSKMGTFYLRESNSAVGCGSVWADILSQYTNLNGLTVTAIGMWENNDDGSHYGGLDAMPHFLTNGAREDTFIDGETTLPGNCFYEAIDITDGYGVALGPFNVSSDSSWCTG